MKSLSIGIACVLLALSTAALAADPIQRVERPDGMPSFLGYAPDACIVVMRPDVGKLRVEYSADEIARVGDPALDALADRFRVSRIRQQFPGSESGSRSRTAELARYHKVNFEAGSLEEVMAAYEEHPLVERVEPIGIHALYATPNDTYFSPYQTYHYQANDHDIDTPEAWDIQTGSTSVIVAILDSGTRYYHPDLGGVNATVSNPQAARGNMWINWAEKNGTPGVDDDSNGYTDDWIGYDFIDGVSNCWPGEDCNDKDNDPRDFNGHGTHTAGIVGMLTNDGYGMAGVAGGWDNGSQAETGNGVKVMPLRMGYSYNWLGQEYGVVMMDAAAEAFYYAANNGAVIASCSWGSSNSGGLGAAVDYFLSSGGLVFVAAGNDGDQVADYLNGRGDCISVSAVDANDAAASFTTYGTWVDICAPGVSIYSTYHDHTDPNTTYWASMSGTSMSTPMAAAVGALIWSQNPGWTAAQVESQLCASAENIDAYLSPTYIGKMGAGRINAFDAVNTGPPPPPVAAFVGSPTSGPAPLTVNFTDQSTGSIDSWSWVFGDGGTSAQQNPSHQYAAAGTYTVTLTVTGPGGSDDEVKTDYIDVTEPEPYVRDFARSDIPVAGTVTGNYTDTHASDDAREQIRERESGGKPDTRHTFLEHKWSFNVTGGTSVAFFVEAYRNDNSEGDDFVFAYSTNDISYTDLMTVASASEQVYAAPLPPSLSGTVYVRVRDTDQTAGNRAQDTVFIDQMYFESVSGPMPPVAAFIGTPTAGAAPLTVWFTDQSTGNPTSWAWDFGDGVGTSTTQNPSYTYDLPGAYTVTLTATNAHGSDGEQKTDYITVTEPGTSMHVADIAVTRQKIGPNHVGVATITIVDQYDQAVAGATVYATATGPTGGSLSGITDGSGVAILQTAGMKKPAGEWCFEVTNVTHPSYTYDSAANVVTMSCEGGDVYGWRDGLLAVVTEFAAGSRPNPFAQRADIFFALPAEAHVRVEVFNVAGRKVAVLADRSFDPGRHTLTWDAGQHPSGVYFYRIEAGAWSKTQKMMLLR